MKTFLERITSRKFLICLASFMGSIGTSIAGIKTDSEVVTAIGIVCAVLSSAIYAACEAYVDKAAVVTDVIDTNDTEESE